MPRPGRPRKPGARFPSGGLRQPPDHGTAELRLQRARGSGLLSGAEARLWAMGRAEEAVATVANISGQGVDAVGRAYVSGFLLHPERTGAQMRDAGRVLFKLYWAHYADLRGMAVSSLYTAMVSGGSVRGGASDDGERWRRIEEALNRRLDILADFGRETRKAVESLCIDHHFDEGPDWLDRLILQKSLHGRGAAFETADWARMQFAVAGLAAIA